MSDRLLEILDRFQVDILELVGDEFAPKQEGGSPERKRLLGLIAEIHPLKEAALKACEAEVDKARREQLDRSLEVLKEIMEENFHYRMMCGEIRDPDGIVDVHKEFIRYQELEPERKKFADYLEERKAHLNTQNSEES